MVSFFLLRTILVKHLFFVHVCFVQVWGAGGTMVVHLPLTTVTGVRFHLRAVI